MQKAAPVARVCSLGRAGEGHVILGSGLHALWHADAQLFSSPEGPVQEWL